jgi:glycosyltransferase involved in cell wall biosynthesis
MLWPSVPAWRLHGRLLLDRKFKDGMDAWCRSWPGRVKVVMHVVDIAQEPAFGAHPWSDGSAAPFDLLTLDQGAEVGATQLHGVDVLLASADDHRQLGVAALCRRLGVRCIYIIEYTLRTRFDMLRYSGTVGLARLKTAVWLMRNERRLKRALGEAAAIQSNGLPAERAYAGSAKNTMHYFDTRLPAREVIDPSALEMRLAHLRQGHPLRLAFSGRLIAAKGADALVPLAIALQARGVKFTFDVYGSGDAERKMTEQIAAHRLQAVVRLNGPVDFDTALVPALQSGVDLFVCCHRQGDPSCTYAETLGCGVPIVGFANESLSSLIEAHQIGWQVRTGDIAGLADLIARLSQDREAIATKSNAAAGFGQRFNLEQAFEQRSEHCARILAAR